MGTFLISQLLARKSGMSPFPVLSAQPGHRYVRLQHTLRTADAAFEAALLAKAERFVELAGTHIALRGDELDAFDHRAVPAHIVEQSLEQPPADAAALRLGMDGDRQSAQYMREPPDA